MVDSGKMRKYVSFCLRSLNYFGVACGFVGLRIDFKKQKTYESKYVNIYVTILNVLTIALLPCAHLLTMRYITSNISNSLIAFTDLVTIFIRYFVVAFSVVSRCRRQKVVKELSIQLFALDSIYFNQTKTNLHIQTRADWIILVKIITLLLEIYVPFFGVIKQSSRLDIYVILLAIYSSFIACTLESVIFLYFFMTWQVRQRMWQINVHLEELFERLAHLQRHTSGMLSVNSVTVKQLSILAAEDLRKTAGAHAQLSSLLLRLNAAYECQIVAVLLNCMISYISYGYYWIVTMQTSSTTSYHQNVLSILGWLMASLIVFIDINLLYWASDATTRAYQETAQTLRHFQELPLMDKAFENQCEAFSLQLKQQKMHFNICGMFNLNRQSSLALWAFIVRHIILLVQFDEDERMKAVSSNLVLDEINRWLEFGENEAS